MRSVELFSGAGGLAMGVSNAGFRHDAIVEWDKNACNTIRLNQELGIQPIAKWPLHEMDVRDFDYSTIKQPVELLAGGPPCQPFSLGGKHGGNQDERNMFPEVFRAARVIIVGFRKDLEIEWSFPQATHSQDALFVSQWVTGEYWERHKVPKKERPPAPEKLSSRLERLQSCLLPVLGNPWATVRDAISDLPTPVEYFEDSKTLNHWINPGARSYPGHTGSPLDEPAKTLKAGDHGVPGGENTLAYADGSVRYFSVREAARLQTFPDEFVFQGVWTEGMRQLGNAVPVKLAEVIAGNVHRRLRNHEFKLRSYEY